MSTELSSAGQQVSTRPVGWRGVSRGRAFLTHLTASAVIVGAVCALVFLVWYPHPYFQISGAWVPVRVLIGVDLVLGPLLTLMLFKPGKKGLLLDVSVILVVQVAALVYGVTVIYSERPFFNVFAVDRFNILTRSDVDPAEWAKASERLGTKPLVGPILAVAERPTDAAAQQRLLDETLFQGGPDIDHRPALWVPYGEHANEITAQAKPLDALHASRPEVRAQLEQLPARLGLPVDRLRFLPITVRDRFLAVVIDAGSGALLEAIDQDPWAAD